MIESLCLGTPVIVCDWACLPELGVTSDYGFILPLDMKNIPVQEIYTKDFNFKYQPPIDTWNNFLSEGPSTYEEDKQKMHKVRATDAYKKFRTKDAILDRIPNPGEEWEVDYDRMQLLLGENKKHIKFVEEVR
jgi:hypothetical protein